MQVKGESTFWFDLTGKQQFEEASVKREGSGLGFLGIFGSKKLTIDAGAGDDVITVKKAGADKYEVDINGQKFILSAEEMKNLTLKGGEGNDTIIIDDSVDIAINVDGGAGDDTIVNYANGTKIDGGDGDDLIVSVAHFAEIMGGAGRDDIYVYGMGNEIYGDNKKNSFLDLLFGTHDEADNIHAEGFFNSVKD